MTEKQLQRTKLGTVMSLKAYQYLAERVEHSQAAQPEGGRLSPVQKFTTNSKGRFMRSTMLEIVALFVLRQHGFTARKQENTGKRHTYNGKVVYSKNKNIHVGQADIVALRDGIYYEFEVKIGADRQKEKQKLDQAAITANGGQYYVIKSLDDLIEILVNI